MCGLSVNPGAPFCSSYWITRLQTDTTCSHSNSVTISRVSSSALASMPKSWPQIQVGVSDAFTVLCKKHYKCLVLLQFSVVPPSAPRFQTTSPDQWQVFIIPLCVNLQNRMICGTVCLLAQTKEFEWKELLRYHTSDRREKDGDRQGTDGGQRGTDGGSCGPGGPIANSRSFHLPGQNNMHEDWAGGSRRT